MELFITQLNENPAYYFSTVAAFTGSICLHEFCHAFVAHRLGDDTAKEGGFMTLNPLKVMGWMSIVALLLFGISWGAVPVQRDDPSRLRRSAISLAGPLSNLIMLGLTALLLKGLYMAEASMYVGSFMYYCRLFVICLLFANAILFLFNILPIPQLDGWGIIEPFMPKSLIPSEKSKNAIFRVFIYAICFTSASGIFDKALESFTNKFLPREMNAVSIVLEGEKCLEAEDYAGAYKAFSEAAEQGSLDGKVGLALCLFEGWGCEADQAKAYSLFDVPEVLRYSPVARFYTAVLLAAGEVCERNDKRAFALMSDDEVQANIPGAKYCLGLWYYAGLGTKQDFVKAARVLKEAADAGDADAMQFLGYQNGKMPDYGMPLPELLERAWAAETAGQ